jgi:hypothetical protein
MRVSSPPYVPRHTHFPWPDYQTSAAMKLINMLLPLRSSKCPPQHPQPVFFLQCDGEASHPFLYNSSFTKLPTVDRHVVCATIIVVKWAGHSLYVEPTPVRCTFGTDAVSDGIALQAFRHANQRLVTVMVQHWHSELLNGGYRPLSGANIWELPWVQRPECATCPIFFTFATDCHSLSSQIVQPLWVTDGWTMRNFNAALGSRICCSPESPNRLWVPRLGLFPPGVMRPGHDAEHAPPSTADVTNEWSCTSVFPIWRQMLSMFCGSQLSWKVLEYAHARRSIRAVMSIISHTICPARHVQSVRTLIYCGLFNWFNSRHFWSSRRCSTK